MSRTYRKDFNKKMFDRERPNKYWSHECKAVRKKQTRDIRHTTRRVLSEVENEEEELLPEYKKTQGYNTY